MTLTEFDKLWADRRKALHFFLDAFDHIFENTDAHKLSREVLLDGLVWAIYDSRIQRHEIGEAWDRMDL